MKVKYCKKNVGEVLAFNPDDGIMVVSLDLREELANIIKSMILNDIPLSLNIKNKKYKKKKKQ